MLNASSCSCSMHRRAANGARAAVPGAAAQADLAGAVGPRAAPLPRAQGRLRRLGLAELLSASELCLPFLVTLLVLLCCSPIAPLSACWRTALAFQLPAQSFIASRSPAMVSTSLRTQDDVLWACLAAMALNGEDLDTAEVALAAINEVGVLIDLASAQLCFISG